MPRRRPEDESDFASFAAVAAPRLGRTARLLTADRHLAEDLVQSTLLAVYLRWHRVGAMDAPHAYAQRVLYTTFCSWRGRRWTAERPMPDVPERAAAGPDGDPAEQGGHGGVAAALARLPRRQRAVVVARFYDDLSVEQTAALLGCTTGTVKTHTSRALHALRAVLREATVL
jgi:RNA polymerase sigma-70 factor (sigma-E family)